MRHLLLAMALATPLTIAETLTVPLGGQGDPALSTPTRGATMSNVAKAFGQPQSIRAGVGDPPITTWQYPQFRVYFEYDKVIHSVKNRTAADA